MFKFKFASDFFNSKTTWQAIVATAGAVAALLNHKTGLFPTLAFLSVTWHLTWLRDTLQKLGELDPALTDAGEGPETPPSPDPTPAPEVKN